MCHWFDELILKLDITSAIEEDKKTFLSSRAGSIIVPKIKKRNHIQENQELRRLLRLYKAKNIRNLLAFERWDERASHSKRAPWCMGKACKKSRCEIRKIEIARA